MVNGRMIGVLMLVLLGSVLGGCREVGPNTPPPPSLSVEIGDEVFDLELALTASERYMGLSDREAIAADGGMLFAFVRPQELSFVMRKCLVPIDVIFLSSGGRIVAMHEMKVEPYNRPNDELKAYRSGWPAQFAIELKGGTLGRLGVEAGDEIGLPLMALKAWVK